MPCRESGPKMTKRPATAFAHSMAVFPPACSDEGPQAPALMPRPTS